MKRGMPEQVTFRMRYSASSLGIRIDTRASRIKCPHCGTSWPLDAPELSCTCPPNADTGARAREGI